MKCSRVLNTPKIIHTVNAERSEESSPVPRGRGSHDTVRITDTPHVCRSRGNAKSKLREQLCDTHLKVNTQLHLCIFR